MTRATHETIKTKLDNLETLIAKRRTDANADACDYALNQLNVLRTHAKRTARTDHAYLGRISRHATVLHQTFNAELQHYA